jgi:hypothetical protein
MFLEFIEEVNAVILDAAPDVKSADNGGLE